MSVSGWSIYTAPIEEIDAELLGTFLADQQGQNLVSESRTLELKSRRTTGAVDTVAAFANTVGGILLIGIDEKTPTLEVAPGVKKDEHTSFTQTCISKLDPVFTPEIGVVALPDKDRVVLVVRVEPQYEFRPVTVDGRVLVRTPGSTVGATRDQIQLMFQRRTAAGMPEVPLTLDGAFRIRYDEPEAAPDFTIRVAGSLSLRELSAQEFFFGQSERETLCAAFASSLFALPRIRFDRSSYFPSGGTHFLDVQVQTSRHVEAQVAYGGPDATQTHVMSFDIRMGANIIAYAVTWEGWVTPQDKRDETPPRLAPEELTVGLLFGLEAVTADIPNAVASVLGAPPAGIGPVKAWVETLHRQLSNALDLGHVSRPYEGKVSVFGLAADPAPRTTEEITTLVHNQLTRLLLDLGVNDENTVATRWMASAFKDRETVVDDLKRGRLNPSY
jgi:hypothetical protein